MAKNIGAAVEAEAQTETEAEAAAEALAEASTEIPSECTRFPFLSFFLLFPLSFRPLAVVAVSPKNTSEKNVANYSRTGF